MFKLMEISEFVYKDAVEPSYKQDLLGKMPNCAGHISNIRRETTLKDRYRHTFIIHGPRNSSDKNKVLG